MNLYKRTYVKNWEHMKDDERHCVAVTGNKGASIKPERVAYVVEEVAYWRKANAIHNWLVQNCNGGDDNNGEFEVSFDDLKELARICSVVVASAVMAKGKIRNGYTFVDGKLVGMMEDGEYIAEPSIAHEHLPTCDGCFFGSTDYDQYYLENVKFTADTLNALIAEDGADRADYYYSASW